MLVPGMEWSNCFRVCDITSNTMRGGQQDLETLRKKDQLNIERAAGRVSACLCVRQFVPLPVCVLVRVAISLCDTYVCTRCYTPHHKVFCLVERLCLRTQRTHMHAFTRTHVPICMRRCSKGSRRASWSSTPHTNTTRMDMSA